MRKVLKRNKSCWLYRVVLESKDHLASDWNVEHSFNVRSNGVKEQEIVCRDIISKYMPVYSWNKRISILNSKVGVIDTFGGMFGNEVLDSTLNREDICRSVEDFCLKTKVDQDGRELLHKTFNTTLNLVKKDVCNFDNRVKKRRTSSMTSKASHKIDNYNKANKPVFKKIEDFCTKLVMTGIMDLYSKYREEALESNKNKVKNKVKNKIDNNALKLKFVIDVLNNTKELLCLIHSDFYCGNLNKELKRRLSEYNKLMRNENSKAELYLVKYYDSFDLTMLNENTDWEKESFIPNSVADKFKRKRLTFPYVRKTNQVRKQRATKKEMAEQKENNNNKSAIKVKSNKKSIVKKESHSVNKVVEQSKNTVTLDVTNEDEVLNFIRNYLNIKW